MTHIWKTKFEPGDKVKTASGPVGEIVQIHIMFLSGEDMDHWRKTLPKIAGDKYQYTSYSVKFGNEEYEHPERVLILVA